MIVVPRATAATLIAIAAVSVVGCGGDDEPAPEEQAPAQQRYLPGKTVTDRNGAEFVTPPRPTRYETEPIRGCLVRRSGNPKARVLMPPTPGISAHREGNRVIVNYRFEDSPAQCRPAVLHVSVDVNRDSLAASGRAVGVKRLEGTVEVLIPPLLREADVANVIARSHERVPGRAISVLIRGRG